MTNTPNDGGPAFPMPTALQLDRCTFENTTITQNGPDTKIPHTGISVRDYFAAAALQGMLADIQCNAPFSDSDAANDAYKIADAMLAERAKQ